MEEQGLAALHLTQEGKGMIAGCLMELGDIATRQRDFDAAHTYMDQGMALMRELGNKQQVREYFLWLAELYQAEGNYTRAIQCYRAIMVEAKRNTGLLTPYLVALTNLVAKLGRYELAATLLGTIDALDESGFRVWPLHRADCNCCADAARAHLGTFHFEAASAQGRMLTFEQVVEHVLTMVEAMLNIEQQPASA